MDIELTFADSISEVYREKLQTFSDSILALGFTENRPPCIEFTGMNKETFTRIEKLRIAHEDRYGMTEKLGFRRTY